MKILNKFLISFFLIVMGVNCGGAGSNDGSEISSVDADLNVSKSISGIISSSDKEDTDTYDLGNVPAGTTISATVKTKDFDAILSVGQSYDNFESEDAYGCDDDCNESLIYEVSESGQYYLAVTSYDGGTGSYTLEYSLTSGKSWDDNNSEESDGDSGSESTDSESQSIYVPSGGSGYSSDGDGTSMYINGDTGIFTSPTTGTISW